MLTSYPGTWQGGKWKVEVAGGYGGGLREGSALGRMFHVEHLPTGW